MNADFGFGALVYADHWEMLAAVCRIGVIHNALDCLEFGAEPELSYKKALRASEIIFAFCESVRRHARVPLTSISDNLFLSMLQTGRFSE